MYGDTLITSFKDYIDEMFERGEHGKGSNINAYIMEVDMQIIYPDDYALPQVPGTKRYVDHLMNKKRTRETINFDDHIYNSGRRGHKSEYRDKYTD